MPLILALIQLVMWGKAYFNAEIPQYLIINVNIRKQLGSVLLFLILPTGGINVLNFE
jgi:hypothetical protein